MSPFTVAILAAAIVMLPAWLDFERADGWWWWYRPFRLAAMWLLLILLTPEFLAGVAHIIWHQLLVGWS